nr:unnamed protein product [Callosobruchus chinensis]
MTLYFVERGGTVADAAIAVLLCEAVVMPGCLGLGGGFLMTHYKRRTRQVLCLNARETAPKNSHKDMFQGNRFASQYGGLAVGIPGELLGYWYMYQRFGKGVPWKEIIQPSIDLCTNGFYVSEFTADSIRMSRENIISDPMLREMMVNPETNDLFKEGEFMHLPKLADTLRVIQAEGGTALNEGSLAKQFVQDIKNRGGIITMEDMKDYKPVWSKAVSTTLSTGQTLYSIPLPGSGVLLAFILNILDGFLSPVDFYSLHNFQKLVESFKFAYGARTRLGDRDTPEMNQLLEMLLSKDYAKDIRTLITDCSTFNSMSYYGANLSFEEDKGTSNIVILAPNGDAIVVTSGINATFGAFFGSTNGIILNNEMDDFSAPGYENMYNLPPSPTNFVRPGKRPMSSMCPSLILDRNGDVVMAIGGAGGSTTPTALAQVIIKHLWYNVSLKAAMAEGRIHHQLLPNVLQPERLFAASHPDVIQGLQKIGHKIQLFMYPTVGFAALTAVSTVGGTVEGCYDVRRGGSVAYLF